jgi:hypothetical protein
MELLVKLYAHQSARIGVKYTYEFQAVRAYEDLVRTAGDSELSAVMELSGAHVHLSLTSAFNGKTVHYKQLGFHEQDLRRLAQLSAPFMFVHIFPQHNTLLIAKPFRRAKFLQITHLELRGTLAGQL